MMLETNNISFIALSLMSLSFFYYVYSISIKENLIKFIGSVLLLSSVSIISSMFIHNGLMSICILGLCLILFKQDSVLECLFISLYFIFLKVLTYVIMTWGINIFIYDLVLPIHDTIYGSDILLCVFLDVLLALGKNTVKKEEDFKRLFHVDSLGVLPHAKFHKKRTQVEELIVLDNPRLPRSFLEASRTVRRRIERAQKETGMKSFLVTSAMPGEGKSTVSANIAISLAMKGYKVILVDADLRNPSTAKVLGMQEQELGTLQVLKGEVKIEDAVQPYKDTSVMVLAGSSPIQDTSTVLSGENMRQFIKELEAKADFVVIDTPPSAMLSDAAIVAQYVDGAVFVIRQDYTEADRILEGMEILSSSGAQITGCILNDANVKGNSSEHYKNSYRLKGEVKV